MKVSLAVHTDVGKRRKENQDSYGYLCTPSDYLFLVADGMGGARGGATASALAVHLIARYACDEEGTITIDTLRDAIERASAEIYARSSSIPELEGMGTTIVAVLVSSDDVYVAHVGDSRIYGIRDGGIDQLTKDHSLVQELVESGAITDTSAEHHPIGHMLTRSIGPQPNVEVEVRKLDENASSLSTLLLCCDGLVNMVSDQDISSIVSQATLDDAAVKLVEKANEAGGNDNITVMLLNCSGEEASGENALSLSRPGEVQLVASSSLPSFKDGALMPRDSLQPVTETLQLPLPPPNDELLASISAESPSDDLDSFKPVDPSPVDSERQRNLLIGGGMIFLLLLILLLRSSETKQEKDPDLLAKQTKLFGPASTAESLVEGSSVEELEAELLERTTLEDGNTESSPEEGEMSEDEVARESSVMELEAELLDASGAAEEGLAEDENSVASLEVGNQQIDTVGGGDSYLLEDSAEEAAVNVVIRETRKTEVPPQPAVPLGDDTPSVKIDWQKEQEAQKPKVAPIAVTPAAISKSQKIQICAEKYTIREKIAEVDAKMNIVNAQSAEKLNEKAKAFEAEIGLITEAIQTTNGERESAEALLNEWKEIYVSAKKDGFLAVADRVGLRDPAIREHLASLASLRQSQAEAAKKLQAGDIENEKAPHVAAMARRIKSAEVALSRAIETQIADSLKSASDDVERLTRVERRLRMRRDRLYRQSGYLAGYTVLSTESKKPLLEQFADKREELVSTLNALKGQVSDAEELRICMDKPES